MGKTNTFLKRLQSLENLPKFLDRKRRFAKDEHTAHKTLGFILVSLKSIECSRTECDMFNLGINE